MTCKESIKWLENLKSDLGKSQFSELWHYEQALAETIELLKSDNFKDKSRIIEPTLNVGEKVWFLHRSSNEICEATVTRVEYNYFTNPQEWIEIEYISSSIGRLTYKTRIDLMLGKVVFFTKEEAETKLKELNGNES